MNEDQLIRLILLAAFVLLTPIRIHYRLKARTGEALDRRQEGPFVLITLRLVGLAGLFGLVAYLINPAWMAWSSIPLSLAMRWNGVGLRLVGGGLFVWTFQHLGKNLTDTVVTRKEHTLVTTGPYRWIRHPFYTSIAFTVLGNSLAAANWFLLVTSGGMFVLLVIRTRKEEENLEARFGDDYRNYLQRTGRFLPRF